MSLCNNQENFNHAFYKALKHSTKKNDKKMMSAAAMYMIVHLIFLVVGVMLALQRPEEEQIAHITLAIVFSPAYVFAYYLNHFCN